MTRLTITSTLLTASLGLSSPAAVAAPNYYSQSGSRVEARLAVVAPKGGRVEPGQSLSIAWTKQTPDVDVDIWLYTASGDGIRGEKVSGIVPPKGTAMTARGGSFDWVVPEELPKGTYVVVVTSGLDEATSPSFSVTEPAVKLSPLRTDQAAIVRQASLEGAGSKGAVTVASTEGEVSYEWGTGQCPGLMGGLGGALAALAALGNVTIVPIVRDVTRKGKVEQICLDGFVVRASDPAPPSAAR